MTKTQTTPQSEPAIRVLSIEEMKQAAGGLLVRKAGEGQTK